MVGDTEAVDVYVPHSGDQWFGSKLYPSAISGVSRLKR